MTDREGQGRRGGGEGSRGVGESGCRLPPIALAYRLIRGKYLLVVTCSFQNR
jgi:hypothetical protein